MDFVRIELSHSRNNETFLAPRFRVGVSNDIMIRGGAFYAIWDEDKGLWNTDEYEVVRLVDKELWEQYDQLKTKIDTKLTVKTLEDFSSGSWESFKRFMKNSPDHYVPLDNKIVFADDVTTREDYVSKKLPYSLSKAECVSWNELMSTLYSPTERRKIEWAIGSILTGDAQYIQKFIVLYGEAGSGKSTVLNVIQKIFDGYYCMFDARALATISNQFSLEVFKSNPLVAIQHDGDLSRIEDNSRLNSIVSHEEMVINEKHKALYAMRMNAFLFMATNKPVKITDAKSGLIRRLIDVVPSGNLIEKHRYLELLNAIDFEIGSIANHCIEVYKQMGPNFYDGYKSSEMRYKTDVFFNFVDENYFVFTSQDGITLKQAYAMYKEYCDESSLNAMPMYKFREELKNYFADFKNRVQVDGVYYRSYYMGFLKQKFLEQSTIYYDEAKKKEAEDLEAEKVEESGQEGDGLSESGSAIPELTSTESLFDILCADCPAQYANEDGRPLLKWTNVKTTLKDLDTTRTHYVRLPENHIVIDFDLKDPETGVKSAEMNLEAASKFPKTYTEFSKSGAGIHLHYIYDGDSSVLSRLYSDGIEIKVFSGNSSLRRRLSKCNNEPIAHISGGLPLKEKKVISTKQIKSEKTLRDLIVRNLHKEIHPATKPSIDFIFKILDEAYESGMTYDVRDLESPVLAFAANSTNQAAYCIKTVGQMKFRSKDKEEESNNLVVWVMNDLDGSPNKVVRENVQKAAEDDTPIVFFDIEVFPNLLLINYKEDGPEKPMHRLINPAPKDIEPLFNMKLVGYNNRRYDNHIIYARWLGKSLEQLYHMSKAIISGTKEEQRAAMYGEAYNISYTDIYDFASAGNKMSLKKAEIEMGIHHLELGMDWDKPVDESEWVRVSEYCDNDVLATEARFHWLRADWTARQILADLAGMTVNDTTNTLTTHFIFGNNRNPQSQFNYRDLGKPVGPTDVSGETLEFLKEAKPLMLSGDKFTSPIAPDVESVLPYFPGYKFEWVKKEVAGRTITKPMSTYRGVEVGEGGYVYAEPGMYTDVALLDITSMHPNSIIAECLFGPIYTRLFKDIVDSRVEIKHEDWDIVFAMLDGQLAPYVNKVLAGELTSKDLAGALKTAINAVYGLTSAKFPNAFRDKRNVDNIVAKRGALFMVDLKNAVQEMGYVVAHIKTDSIKIPNATPEIIQFVMDFGAKYGYNFEHEATYDRMCLVNKSTYIARYKTGKHAGEWTATGAQFQHPFVFKTLFSKEPITFDDCCEVRTVNSSLYLDMNEGLPLHAYTQEEYDAEIERIVDNVLTKNTQLINNAKDPESKREEVINNAVARYKGPKVGDLVETHNYVFVGRAGQFCPIEKDCGGGILVQEHQGKFVSAQDADGYRWLESEMVRNLHMEDSIDMSYQRKKVDDAVAVISKYGDFNWFVSNDVDPNKINIP